MSELQTISTTQPISTLHLGSMNIREQIEVSSMVGTPYGHLIFVVMGNNKMSQHQTERPLPAHMYVDLIILVTKASMLVFLICLFSLAVSAIDGFHMVHPFVAIIVMIGCLGFYSMTRFARKQYKADV